MYFSVPSHTTSSCYSKVAWTFSLHVYRVSAQTCGPLDWMQQVIIINCAFVVKRCFDFPVWVCREINTAETQEEETRTESRLFSQSNMILYSSCGTLFIFSLSFGLSFCVWPKGSFSTELAQTGGQRQRKLGRHPFFDFPSTSHWLCQQWFGFNWTSKPPTGAWQPSGRGSAVLSTPCPSFFEYFSVSASYGSSWLKPRQFFQGFKLCGCTKLISSVRYSF